MTTSSVVYDPERLAALADYDILDTPAEQGFDDLVQIARHICNAPVALVSLVAGDRQWFKARSGFEPCQTDLNSSVCAYALLEPDLLVIPDLTADNRTRNNPLVTGDPHIRFYAGAPLRTPYGQTIGSLCVIDTKPRPEGLSPREADALRALARQVMSQLDLRQATTDRLEGELRRNGLMELGDRLRDLRTASEMVRAASEVLGKALSASRVGYGELDETAEIVTVINDWTDRTVASIAGVHRFADYGRLRDDILSRHPLLIENVDTDPRTCDDPSALRRIDIAALINVLVVERDRPVAVIFVHSRTPRRWPVEVVTFVRNVADRLETGIARLRAQQEQRVLNDELSHRMKNMMAMVQAIASQTLKNAQDKPAVAAFTRRIHTLSLAHDALVKQASSTAYVRDIVGSVLDTFGKPDRFVLNGPPVRFGPRAALSLAMLIHELGTNATKYGSLSADGTLVIEWAIESEDFVLRWREVDGPPAVEPSTAGFGSRLIRMGLIGTGRAKLSYNPFGFEGEFAAPLEQLQH